ncbi:tetratricopeptide repeat protein [Arsukibacterium indicum]|uniref:Tetratricopeptide repeat protein n=1 Tax=Arsukibacterium indicum TaxID=2848612 RepID=A0ABS6MIR6_9GAMM|nr:tetratricopeptide repeat protein [Arsukibacterium indicum]MBV2128703.1 tetratricopeptide repeat protein [Arsukibacterium indicum]
MRVVMRFLSELRRRKVIQTLIPFLGVIWLLLQIIAVVTPLLNLSPFVATSLTIFLFACFPVVFYLAWYFDITPQGIKVTEVDYSEHPKPLGFKWWLGLSVVIVGSLMLGLHYFDNARTDYAKRNEGLVNSVKASSIAVLPFRDQSPDSDQQYLAAGITEELATILGQVDGLQVASASAGFSLARQNLLPVDIARRLKVDTLLSGSIHKIGNQIRLRVELINAEDGMTLWSQSFSRELSDIFAVETEIARAVANLLQQRYLEAGSLTSLNSTSSTDAYLMYLRGREQYRLQTTESIKEARRLFEQALALDPEYAMAYVALADTIILLAEGSASFGVLKADIAATLAEQHLAKALVRAPELAEAHAVRGLLLFYLQSNYDAALPALDKALSLNPNLAQVHLWRFAALEQLGRSQDAWQALQQAHRLDPIAITHQYNLAFKLAERGELTLAEQQYRQLIADFPDSPMGYAGLADLYTQTGELADSLDYWQQAYRLSPENNNFQVNLISTMLELQLLDKVEQLTSDKHYEATLLLRRGRYNELIELMTFQLAANPEDPWVAFEAGWYQLLVGDKAQGIELLLQAHQYFQPADLLSLPMCSPALEIAWAYKQRQQAEAAAKLIRQCTDTLPPAGPTGYQDIYRRYLNARLAALQNRPEQALTELSAAVNQGWRQWWSQHDPLLAPIADTTEAEALFSTIEQALQVQRAKAVAKLQNTLNNPPD